MDAAIEKGSRKGKTKASRANADDDKENDDNPPKKKAQKTPRSHARAQKVPVNKRNMENDGGRGT